MTGLAIKLFFGGLLKRLLNLATAALDFARRYPWPAAVIVLMVALGIVLGLSKDAFGFFFQSSQSSTDKNAVIASLQDQATGKADDPVNIAPAPVGET